MKTAPIQSEILPGAGSAMVYTEWIVEFSAATTAHFNRLGQTAENRHPSEFVPFRETAYLGFSVPLQPLPRESGLKRYSNFRVVVDGTLEFRLGDHPRFMSYRPGELELFRGGPTHVSVDLFPDSFFGKHHAVHLYEGDDLVFGPSDRFFPDRTSGALYRELEDGEGKLVARVSNLGLEGLTGHGVNPKPLIPILTDPVFGVPTGATMITASGRRQRLPYQLIGEDYVGDKFLFNEGVLWDMEVEPGDTVIEIDFPSKGTGYACILWGGYTLRGACRADATVS